MTTSTTTSIFAALMACAKEHDSKFKPQAPKESEKDFLTRLVETLADVPEESFEAMPQEARDWFDESVGHINAKEAPETPEGYEFPAPVTVKGGAKEKGVIKPRGKKTDGDASTEAKPEAEKPVKSVVLAKIASKRDAFSIDPRKLSIEDGFNARDFETPENAEHVAELKESIRDIGVQTSLTVRVQGDKVFLTDGECRYRAVMDLIEEGVDIKTIPVQEEDKHANESDRIAGLVVRNSGKPLAMMEQGKVYRRLLGYGWTKSEVSKRVGKTPMHIDNCLELVAAPDEVKELVKSGIVAGTTAVQTMRREGESAGEVLKTAANTAKQAGKTKVSGTLAKSSGKAASKPSGMWISTKKVKIVVAAIHEVVAQFPEHESVAILQEALDKAKLDDVDAK